ncbi:hypothetical protein G3I13_00770 [Streptomyces sp. SID6673]|nr:hypothetical protein [Streptomyces sp. SID11726]NEB22857.1 hypothetical protein [Streptomyces sp. SID6673]
MSRSTRSTARLGLLLTILAGTLVVSGAPAGAAPLSGPVVPTAVPAGSTIEPPLDCRPTKSHPDPVVVLPGADGTTSQTSAQWRVVTSALRRSGACAFVFQGGIIDEKRWAGDIPGEAVQVERFVRKVRGVTGATKVDIVAHSAGSVVANYYLKVRHGAPNVRAAVLLAPEGGGCDGVGSLAQYGITHPPITPVQVLQALPLMSPILARILPSMAVALQLAPGSDVYRKLFIDGPVTQNGVHYAIMATKNDKLATPAGTCSFIREPGVTNVFYEDVFPGRPVVDHSSLRSSPYTAKWVVKQLYS